MYVANIKIEKVDSASGSAKRCLAEALNLTVKAATLPKLQEKVTAHINLLDAEDIK